MAKTKFAKTGGIPVRIVWRDAHGGDEGWRFKVKKHHTKGRKVTTVGLLIATSQDGLTISLSRDHKAWGAYIFIPHVNVVSREDLT